MFVLKDPHVFEPHVAVHVIPSPAVPFTRLTLKLTLPPKSIDEGGETNDKERGGGTTFSMTLLDADGLLATAAVKVTVPPMGIMEGAVYKEATPSGVCVGTKVPQAPPVMLPVTGFPPQVTVQFTPESDVSPTGVMLT